jgi:RNA polymerase sigma factor (sigma-70 family)
MEDLASWDDGALLREVERFEDAFEVFYRRHVQAVLAFFAAQGVDTTDAADLTAETFAAAIAASRRYRPEAAPARSWLIGIAEHKLLDRGRRYYRQREAHERLEARAGDLTERDIAEFAALDHGTGEALEALRRLPEEQREVVRARVVDEQNYEEIGRRFRISEETARQRVSRGLRTLRDRLQRGGE